MISGSPKGIHQSLILESNITTENIRRNVDYVAERVNIPLEGFKVRFWFSMGLVLSWGVGVSGSFLGTASVDYGVGVDVPGEAILSVDFVYPQQSYAYGWEGSAFTPTFQVNDLDHTVDLGASSQLKIALELQLNKIAKFDAGLPLYLPGLDFNLLKSYRM